MSAQSHPSKDDFIFNKRILLFADEYRLVNILVDIGILFMYM